MPGFLGYGREQLVRRRTTRHQRGDPPQRRLLLGKPGDPGAALGVRDRHGHQLGEGGETLLGVQGQRMIDRAADHHTPQAALDEDRRPDR
jgi:hypothetical protein